MLSACSWFAPQPGIGNSVDWADIPGWDQDNHAEAWPALLQGCARLSARDQTWRTLCNAAGELGSPSDRQARVFFEHWFVPHRVHGSNRTDTGLITGYYEPLLHGSFERNERFRYPVYRRPKNLLTIDLAELHPTLAGKRVRGQLSGTRVIPYYSRAQISTNEKLLAGEELLWVDDPFALFFLHIQGSGRIQLPNGDIVGVGYADQNGHTYRSIGAQLIEQNEFAREDVNLFTIRRWLDDHPKRAESLLSSNPSYVFFSLRENPQEGAIGSLNVPLTPERSIAVDPKVIPLGTPVWLDTHLPEPSGTEYRRLVMAQDTGGAINGPVRADLFWGDGKRAELMAGLMKQPGRLYVLMTKN